MPKAVPFFPPEPGARDASKPAASPRSLWGALPTLSAGSAQPARGAHPSDERAASEVVALARREAETVRAQARSDADALLAEARRQADAVRQDAFVDGYAAGLASARAEVEEELGARFKARCEALQAGVDAVVEAILVDREALWTRMESEITQLALDIARKVIKVEVSQNPAVIEGVIKDALRRVSDRNNLRIIVNPDQLQQVRDNREDLLLAIDGIKNLEIDSDRRVGRGGCTIETNAGCIDAKIETQLEQVEAALKN